MLGVRFFFFGCNNSFCGCNISFCGYNISFCGCNISFFGCNISFFDCNISFCGYNISFCGYNISFCGCNNSKSDCYILFSACSKSKRDLCFSYATTYNLVDAFLSFKVLHETDAQRFGYCRRRGFLAPKFNRRTKVEPCTNAQSKPFSPAFGNTLLCVRYYFNSL